MAVVYKGHEWFEGERDDDGHRNYVLRCKVNTAQGEGPATIMASPLLPQPGSSWLIPTPVGLGTVIDLDVWAYCTQRMKVRPTNDTKVGSRPTTWVTEHYFTTRPKKRCQEESFTDPLLEPPRVSGGSVRKKVIAELDRFGDPITYSSGEKILGGAVEFDRSDSKVSVKFNVANLEGYLMESLVDHVNDAPLWGYPARWVKFSSWSWEKNYQGMCSVYYTRHLEFEISSKVTDGVVSAGWDRKISDESNKCLKGDWDRDPESATYKRYVLDDSVLDDYEFAIDNEDPRVVFEKPSNVVRYKDWFGENSKTLLNGYGRPYRFPETDETPLPPDPAAEDDLIKGEIDVEYYPEANLLLLGIPADI